MYVAGSFTTFAGTKFYVPLLDDEFMRIWRLDDILYCLIVCTEDRDKTISYEDYEKEICELVPYERCSGKKII